MSCPFKISDDILFDKWVNGATIKSDHMKFSQANEQPSGQFS